MGGPLAGSPEGFLATPVAADGFFAPLLSSEPVAEALLGVPALAPEAGLGFGLDLAPLD